ncbi:MAG: hypothetical protein IPP99_15140 [Chitinophagaceae bacterium]|nr:hypothetical protein [Chitinophagaceae bacterium]MBP6589672.1 hypothetical protein [Chitinophagaceae bacterium]
MKFTTSLDRLATIVTWGVSLLFITIIGVQVKELIHEFSTLSLIVIILLLLVYLFTFLLRPLHYTITDTTLIIQRPLSSKKIARADIEALELFINGELNWAIRTFGVGGLFGYFGRFFKGSIGSMTWYATRRNKAVLIRTKKGDRIVVTPDDYEGFVTALQP